MAFSAMFTSSLQSLPISGGKNRPNYCSQWASFPSAILRSISSKIPLVSRNSSSFQNGFCLKSSIVNGFSANSQNSSAKSRTSSGKVYAKAAREKTIYDYTVKDIDGNDVPLRKFRGKVLLIVNVASKCGLAHPNYRDLSHLYEKYKPQGFEILAFPCNQFGAQEPGSNPEIKNFACTRFNVKFPIFDKVDVNGPNSAPVYRFLKSSSSKLLDDMIMGNFERFSVDKNRKVDVNGPNTATMYGFLKSSSRSFLGGMIMGNFEKFLVHKNGKVVGRYSLETFPLQIEKDIQMLLAA